jgi:hypothetical protein
MSGLPSGHSVDMIGMTLYSDEESDTEEGRDKYLEAQLATLTKETLVCEISELERKVSMDAVGHVYRLPDFINTQRKKLCARPIVFTMVEKVEVPNGYGGFSIEELKTLRDQLKEELHAWCILEERARYQMFMCDTVRGFYLADDPPPGSEYVTGRSTYKLLDPL